MGRGVALDADDPHVERTTEAGQPHADGTEPIDEHGLPGKLLLAPAEVGDHPPPLVRPLPVASGMDVPRQREQQRHRVVAHRVAVDAAAVGKPHAALAQRIEAEPVVTRRADLDEAQVRGPVKHRVGPESRQHQDVALGNAGKSVLRTPRLEVRDSGAAQREPLGEPVGDMGEMDDERVVTMQARRIGVGHLSFSVGQRVNRRHAMQSDRARVRRAMEYEGRQEVNSCWRIAVRRTGVPAIAHDQSVRVRTIDGQLL